MYEEVSIVIARITLSALLFVAFGVLLAVALIAAAAYSGVALARRSPGALAERAGVSGTRRGGWIVGGLRRPLPAPPRGTGGPARRPQARERRRCVIRSSWVVCSVRALSLR